MSKYEYNYNYLADYLKEHKRMKGQIAEAIGTSTSGLDRWVVDVNTPEHRERHLNRRGEKVNPMPVERIIDFCNQLDVDISNFFIQGGEAAKVHPELMKKTVRDIATDSTPIMALKIAYMEEKFALMQKIDKVNDEKNDIIERTTKTMTDQEQHIMAQQHKINELHEQLLEQQNQICQQAKMLALSENGHLQEEKCGKPLIAAEDISDQ